MTPTQTPHRSQLYPAILGNFITRLVRLKIALRAANIQFRVTSTSRSWEEQTDIWNSGRNRPGPIITHARPGRSPHNWGLAADFALWHHGQRITSVAHPSALTFQALVEANLLATGRHWKGFQDPFHVQHPTWKKAITWKPPK